MLEPRRDRRSVPDGVTPIGTLHGVPPDVGIALQYGVGMTADGREWLSGQQQAHPPAVASVCPTRPRVPIAFGCGPGIQRSLPSAMK